MRYDDHGNLIAVYGPNTGRPACPRDSFGNYDPSDALLDHLDDQPAPVGTSRRTTLNSPVGYVALEHES